MLSWTSDRFAEANEVLSRESAKTLGSRTQAEIDLITAAANVKNMRAVCDSIDCVWYQPWNCVAQAGCRIGLLIAEEILKGLEAAVKGGRESVGRSLEAFATEAATARSDLENANKYLKDLQSSISRVPGLADAVSGDIEKIINSALKVNKLAISGLADINTSPEFEFSVDADLVIWESPVVFSTKSQLKVRPIIDTFIAKVRDDFKTLLTLPPKLTLRDISSLRNSETGELDLDDFDKDSVSLNYNGRDFFDPKEPLEGDIPWDKLCSGGYSKLFRIDLSENKLTGGVDSCIFKSVPLEVLSILDNKFSGTVSFPSKKAHRLRSLLLAKNDFYQDLSNSQITNFPNLETLDLSNNKFTGSVKLFKNFKKLTYLNIDNNDFANEGDYGLANLLLDSTQLRTAYYGNNNELSRGVKYQPYPYKIHGSIQLELDYDYFCKAVGGKDRWSNCRLFDLHNKNFVRDLEGAISEWIQKKWEKKYDFFGSYLGLVDPSKGQTKVKTILPMNAESWKKFTKGGGHHTLLSFVYSYPNPNPNGNELSGAEKERKPKDRDMEEAVRGYMRRVADFINSEFKELNFTSKWATTEYSEFSNRRADLATSNIPLPRIGATYHIRTRKAVLGCPPGWIGDDCQYFCENGWKSNNKFTNRIAFEAAQNASKLSWEILELAGTTPTCALPTAQCNSKKCNKAVGEVYSTCGRWVLDQCGNPDKFPDSRNVIDKSNYEECVKTLDEARDVCSKDESYDCSGSVTKRFEDLIDEVEHKKHYCEPPKIKKNNDKNDNDDDNNDDDSDDDNDDDDSNGSDDNRNNGRRDEAHEGGDDDGVAAWMIGLLVLFCVLGAGLIVGTAIYLLVIKKN